MVTKACHPVSASGRFQLTNCIWISWFSFCLALRNLNDLNYTPSPFKNEGQFVFVANEFDCSAQKPQFSSRLPLHITSNFANKLPTTFFKPSLTQWNCSLFVCYLIIVWICRVDGLSQIPQNTRSLHHLHSVPSTALVIHHWTRWVHPWPPRLTNKWSLTSRHRAFLPMSGMSTMPVLTATSLARRTCQRWVKHVPALVFVDHGLKPTLEMHVLRAWHVFDINHGIVCNSVYYTA